MLSAFPCLDLIFYNTKDANYGLLHAHGIVFKSYIFREDRHTADSGFVLGPLFCVQPSVGL